ncbi:MAG: hypothetical protein GTN93_32415, partial [Anaerolineae bacterium]|nr:hypothetical protein [Anaerolineae bacterium]
MTVSYSISAPPGWLYDFAVYFWTAGGYQPMRIDAVDTGTVDETSPNVTLIRGVEAGEHSFTWVSHWDMPGVRDTCQIIMVYVTQGGARPWSVRSNEFIVDNTDV